MQEKRIKLLLIGIIIISLVAAGYAVWQRYAKEAQHRGVDLAIVYDEAVTLARMNGSSIPDVLQYFKEGRISEDITNSAENKGISAVLVKEPTVREAELNGSFSVFSTRELLTLGQTEVLQAVEEQNQAEYTQGANNWYFIFSDQQTFARVKGQLEAKILGIDPNKDLNEQETKQMLALKEKYFKEAQVDDKYILEVNYDWSLLEQIGVGFPREAVNQVARAGLNVYVQLRSWPQVTPDGLHYVFNDINSVPNLTGVLFNDPVLPGVPDQIRPLTYEMQDLNVPLVQIEFSNQVGLSKLGLLLDKNVIRLHTLSLEEFAKKRYNDRDIIDRFALAASERNSRILLLHTYMKTDVPNVMNWNLSLVGEINEQLAKEDLQVGQASTLETLPIFRWLLFVMGLGVIAGGMLLMFVMGWGRLAPYLGLLGLILWTALLAVDMVNPARKLMAFIAVVVFPTLSLALNVKRGGSPIGQSILLLLRTSLFSLVGALLMVGLLADVGFMLKLDQFTGVKLAHVVPLMLLAFIFFFRGDVNREGWQSQLKRFMDQPVLVKFSVIGGIILLALLIYVSRTGNESAAISPLELKFRALLDNLLGVRPRTKEFFLGHPLLMLLFYLGYRDNRYMPLLLGGAIGQISLVNTYAHIHTPLLVSLTRSFNGLWIGIIGGLVLIGLWRIGEHFVKKYYYANQNGV